MPTTRTKPTTPKPTVPKPTTPKSTYVRESLLVRMTMGPIRALNNGFGYLAAVPGYTGIIRPILCFGALAVGIETTYKVMPQTDWSLPREERAFIPKIGVEDSPELSRLIPFKVPVSAVVQWATPDALDRFVPRSDQRTVWSDPAFLLAVLIAAAIQYKESQIFHRKTYAEVRAEAERLNKTQRIEANPSALAIAQVAVAKHNSYGAGEMTSSGVAVLLLYGTEFVAFFFGFKGATSFASAAFWCVYSVFGFEVFKDHKS